MLSSQPIFTGSTRLDELSAASLEDLADYVSGLIVLQSNAAALRALGIPSALPGIPEFFGSRRLPTLVFDTPVRAATSEAFSDAEAAILDASPRATGMQHITASRSWIHKTVNVGYDGIHPSTQEAVLVAEGHSAADEDVLQYLADSFLSRAIHIDPRRRTFAINIRSAVGKPVISQLLEQLLHLNNLIACVSIIQRNAALRVESLSLSHLNFCYRTATPADLSLAITFGKATPEAEIRVLPTNSNPHERIAPALSKILTNPNHSLPTNLSILLRLLEITYPLLSYLEDLQSQSSSTTTGSGSSQLAPRVHVLSRHPTMYGLQYFAPSGSSPLPEAKVTETPRILARFEVLPRPSKSKDRTGQPSGAMWVLRPAMELFQSYNRPSYCSTLLREKLREEIFSRADMDKGRWLPLDTAAACPIHEPQGLLGRVHEVITEWLRASYTIQPSGAASSEAVTEANGGLPEQTQQTQEMANPSPRPAPPKKRDTDKQKAEGTKNANVSRKSNEVIMVDD